MPDIRRYVRLVLDRKSANRMEGQAKKSLQGVETGLASIKRMALQVGATLVAAFGVRQIIRFGTDLLRTATDAEAKWNRVAHAVEGVGVSFSQALPEIEAFARAVQDVTTVGDEDFVVILNELITTSNDYARSLNAVGTVADLATAKQIDLRTAAQLAGRAMIGETGTFKRYGIIIREGESAMEALRRQFGGFAMNEAKSVEGILQQLNNEWGDFKQALGDVLLKSGSAAEGLAALRDMVKSLTEWVSDSEDAFVAMGSAIRDRIVPGIVGLVRIYAGFTRAIVTAAEAQDRFLSGLRRMDGMFFGIRVGKRSDTADARLDALRSYADSLDDLVVRLQRGPSPVTLPPPRVTPTGPDPSAAGPDTGSTEAELSKAEQLMDLWRQYPQVMVQVNEQMARATSMEAGWERLNSEMEMSAEGAERVALAMYHIAEGAKAAGEMSRRELRTVAQVGDAAAAVMAGVLGGNIGEMAKWKAEQNAIMAAEQFAMALTASLIPGLGAPAAAKHVAAGKMFLGIAAAWGALAGATGGFSGGGGGGGRGTPTNTGGGAGERSEPAGPEVHIYLEGEFDMLNPRVQQVVSGTVQNVGELHGANAKINLHRKRMR